MMKQQQRANETVALRRAIFAWLLAAQLLVAISWANQLESTGGRPPAPPARIKREDELARTIDQIYWPMPNWYQQQMDKMRTAALLADLEASIGWRNSGAAPTRESMVAAEGDSDLEAARVGRAFKPKLMSTARGFGKRRDKGLRQEFGKQLVLVY